MPRSMLTLKIKCRNCGAGSKHSIQVGKGDLVYWYWSEKLRFGSGDASAIAGTALSSTIAVKSEGTLAENMQGIGARDSVSSSSVLVGLDFPERVLVRSATDLEGKWTHQGRRRRRPRLSFCRQRAELRCLYQR